MGRIVYAEECLLNYLESLAQSDAYTVGLILGQVGIFFVYSLIYFIIPAVSYIYYQFINLKRYF